MPADCAVTVDMICAMGVCRGCTNDLFHGRLSCLSCSHERLRHRGLQVVGIHTDMGGFAADDYLLDDLEEFIENAEIHFGVVAVHHKYGVPPLLEDGVSLDLERGLQVPVDPESLWAQLKPGEPYKMPVLMVRRNCARVIEAGGLQIKELGDHLAPHCAQQKRGQNTLFPLLSLPLLLLFFCFPSNYVTLLLVTLECARAML